MTKNEFGVKIYKFLKTHNGLPLSITRDISAESFIFGNENYKESFPKFSYLEYSIFNRDQQYQLELVEFTITFWKFIEKVYKADISDNFSLPFSWVRSIYTIREEWTRHGFEFYQDLFIMVLVYTFEKNLTLFASMLEMLVKQRYLITPTVLNLLILYLLISINNALDNNAKLDKSIEHYEDFKRKIFKLNSIDQSLVRIINNEREVNKLLGQVNTVYFTTAPNIGLGMAIPEKTKVKVLNDLRPLEFNDNLFIFLSSVQWTSHLLSIIELFVSRNDETVLMKHQKWLNQK